MEDGIHQHSFFYGLTDSIQSIAEVSLQSVSILALTLFTMSIRSLVIQSIYTSIYCTGEYTHWWSSRDTVVQLGAVGVRDSMAASDTFWRTHVRNEGGRTGRKRKNALQGIV